MSRVAVKSLGVSGLKVSSAPMGAMTFGREASEEECRHIFDFCLERGVFSFDCADVYANGASESILGRLIKPCRKDVVIATKCYFPTGSGANDKGASRRHVLQSVAASLERLQTDWIDIYYIHKFDDHTPMEETISALDVWARRGAVHYIGLSNFSAWQVQKFHDLSRGASFGGVACIQPMYSLLKRQCEVELLPQAASEGFGVLAYSPLAGGLLTGKFHNGGETGGSRLARDAMYQRRYERALTDGRVPAFLALAKQLSLDPVALAVAWVAGNPSVTGPILGARSVEQLRRQLQFAELLIDADLRAELDDIFAPPPQPTDRSEEAAK